MEILIKITFYRKLFFMFILSLCLLSCCYAELTDKSKISNSSIIRIVDIPVKIESVNSYAISPDDSEIAIGTSNKIFFIDLKNQSEKRPMITCENPIFLKYSDNGQFIGIVSADGKKGGFSYYDLNKNELISVEGIKPETSHSCYLSFGKIGKENLLFISGKYEGRLSIIVFNIKTKEIVAKLPGGFYCRDIGIKEENGKTLLYAIFYSKLCCYEINRKMLLYDQNFQSDSIGDFNISGKVLNTGKNSVEVIFKDKLYTLNDKNFNDVKAINALCKGYHFFGNITRDATCNRCCILAKKSGNDYIIVFDTHTGKAVVDPILINDTYRSHSISLSGKLLLVLTKDQLLEITL